MQAQVSYGNTVYLINVEPVSSGYGIGSWNALTGGNHPGGTGRDILYSGITTTTNFSSIRVYKTLGAFEDYAPMTFLTTDLDNFATSDGPSPLGPPGSGHRTVWTIPAETLVITQDVFVRPGSGFATYDNSAIIHTFEFTNTGVSNVRLGLRNLYDWALSDGGGEDGPNASLELVCGGSVIQAPTTFEFSHAPVTADVMRLSVAPGTPTYQAMMALNYDPGFWTGLPVTLPDQVAFVSWPNSYSTDFDYTANPLLNVTSDSATLTWYGRTDGQAIVIAPGTSQRVTQAIFAVMVGDCGPPTVNAVKGWRHYE